MDLFDFINEDKGDKEAPLARRMRPESLDEIVGQEHILGDDGIITTQLKTGNIKSMILWGPPGCGKTSCYPGYGFRPVQSSKLLYVLRQMRRV